MAGVKISALPAIPLDLSTDIGPFVQAGVTYKSSLAQIATLYSSTLTLNTIAQVTGLPAALAGLLPLAGGTMTGNINMGGNRVTNALDPINPQDYATKAYTDMIAGGFTVILAALGATTANLVTTYANGAAGVGATLTDNVGTFLPFAVDGLTPALGSRILVKNQTTTFQNGVYVLTQNGDSISVPYILTRATDYDQAPAEVKPGTLIAVNTGTANANTSWLETATVITMGTDPILFSQFTFAPSTFLVKAANLSDVANVATSRTNLGLGTVATKTASDNTKTIAAMVNGATTIGHIAVFSDITGTIQDGGTASGSVTSVGTSGLATGGPITTTGTIDVAAATQSEQEAATSNTSAVTPAVQKFHPGSAKAWARWQGNPVVISASYNVTGIVRNSIGNYTITYTVPFSSATAYMITGSHTANAGNTSSFVIGPLTASTSRVQSESGGAPVDAGSIYFVAFGDQ